MTDDPSYATLRRSILQAGLLKKRPFYYALKTSVNLSALVAICVAAIWLGNSWWQLAVAVVMAVLFAQLAFVGHDAGHGQVCSSRRGNHLVGLVHANLLTGFSYGWWLTKHNRHHAHCNREGKDPDIAPGFVAFTAVDAARRGGFGKLAVRTQAFFFLPLIAFEAINLQVASVRALPALSKRMAILEGALLLVHAAIYVGFFASVMSPGRLLLFVIVNQGVFGFYLGMTFVTNHTGMPVLDEVANLSFLHRQVRTSRDVRTGLIGGAAYGGLHLQIEHHLFPAMPRPNLSKAQPIVRAFCERHGVPYTERTVLRSYTDVLRHLHRVGKPITQLA